MSTERLITLPELQEAFRRLAAKLSDRGVVGEIYVFGGAAMVLAYKAMEATRDVDPLFAPRELVHSAAVEVADSLALPRWWLNGQATLGDAFSESRSGLAGPPQPEGGMS